MSVSKIHHCISQEMIAQGRDEPPAAKCRCRKYISLAQATQMVKCGEAKWVIIKRTYEPRDLTCPMCRGNKEIKNCAQCFGKGTILVHHPVEEYNNEIVYGSEKPVDKMEKKYRPTLAMKTPRTATIEKKHILRAYVADAIKDFVSRVETGDFTSGSWDVEEISGSSQMMFIRDRTTPQMAQAARDRIEEYGKLIIDMQASFGAQVTEVRYTKNRNRVEKLMSPGRPEPKDDPEIGTGYRFDYGRTI